MKLLHDFIRLRTIGRSAAHRAGKTSHRTWHVTVPAPLTEQTRTHPPLEVHRDTDRARGDRVAHWQGTNDEPSSSDRLPAV